MKRFYKLQIKNDETKINHVEEVIADNRITSHIDYAGPEFELLNKGDLVLVHKGSYPYSLVEVLYKIVNKNEIKGTSFGIDYRVNVKSFFSELDENLDFKKQNKQIGYDRTFIPLYDNKSKTFLFMQSWNTYIRKKEEMSTFKKILSYKKQIILQGPPGTGKTRLAKEIANAIIGSKKTISPLEYVTNYVQHFTPSEQSSKIDLVSQNLLDAFKDTFTLEKIKDLSINDYALGNGSQDSFSYWIEQKLAHTCKFSPGGAGTTVYGISYNRESGNLRVDNGENPEDFMAKVRLMLIDLVGKEDYARAREMKFWYSFILKILHSYNPEKYFPVLSKDHLKFFAKIFEIDTKGLDDVILNKSINEAFLRLKNKFKSPISSIVLMRHLYEKFKIKEGKWTESIKVEEGINISGNYQMIQFHPSYTYEDFVRGISADTNSRGHLEYKVINKVLSEIAQEALLNKDEKYVLIIDEINRANLSSVLGELIYALEYRYYFNDSKDRQSEAEVESLYGLKDDTTNISDRVLKLPENLYIIGTMNTADRSVGHIDYAIRRRFAFVEVLPEVLEDNDEIYFNTTGYNLVAKLFRTTNVSSEFEIHDVQIGHSYFIAKKSEAKDEAERDNIFAMKMQYEVLPILEEYVKDGILMGEFDDKPIREYIRSLKE